jgi:hypothetical protein
MHDEALQYKWWSCVTVTAEVMSKLNLKSNVLTAFMKEQVAYVVTNTAEPRSSDGETYGINYYNLLF